MNVVTTLTRCARGLCRWFLYGLYTSLGALFSGSVAILLLVSYLYHNPHKTNELTQIFAPKVGITVAAFDWAYSAEQLIVSAHHVGLSSATNHTETALKADIEQVQLIVSSQSQLPYLNATLVLVRPVVQATAGTPSAKSTPATQKTHAPALDLQSFAHWSRFFTLVRGLALQSGRIIYTQEQISLDLEVNGRFDWRSSYTRAASSNNRAASSNWSSYITIANRQQTDNKQQYELSVISDYNNSTKQRITRIQVDDSIILRHFAFAQNMFALNQTHIASGNVQAHANIIIASDRDMTWWRASGHTTVSSSVPLPVGELVWNSNGNRADEHFFVHVRDVAQLKLDVSLRKTQSAVALDVQMDHFEFAAVTPILAALDFESEIVGFAGSAQDVVMHMRFVHAAGKWQLQHNEGSLYVDGLAYQLAAGHGAPAFSGISGTVKIDGIRAVLHLESDNFTLIVPQVFRVPMSFSHADGVFEFVTTPQFDRLHTTTRKAVLYPHGHASNTDKRKQAQAVVNMVWGVGARHTLDLDIQVHNMDAAYAKHRFFPNALFDTVGAFLDSSVRSGLITQGTVLLDLDATDTSNVVADVDVALDFVETQLLITDFAPIHADTLRLVTTNQQTHITAPVATMRGVKMTNVAVTVPHAEDSLISVSGAMAGTLADLRDTAFDASLLRVPHQIAMRDILAPFSGQWRADVEATWHLGGEQPPRVEVVVDVDNWQAQDWFGQQVNRFDGTFLYHTDIGLQEIKVRAAHINDAQLTIAATEQHVTLSQVPIRLQQFVPALYTSGQLYADMTLDWSVDLQTLSLEWQPDWRSFGIKTPLFDKPIDTQWNSDIHMSFTLDEAETAQVHGFVNGFHFDVFKQATGEHAGCILYQKQQLNTPVLQACEKETGVSPEHSFVTVFHLNQASASHVVQLLSDVSQVPVIAHATQATPSALRAASILSAPLPAGVDMVLFKSNSFEMKGYDSSPLVVRMTRHTQDTQSITITSDWAKGTAIANSRTNIVKAHFKSLSLVVPDDEHMPPVLKTKTTQEDIDPWGSVAIDSLPAIVVHSEQLALDGRQLGVLDATLFPSRPNAHRPNTNTTARWWIHTKTNGLQLTSSGTWAQQDGQHATNCSLQIDMMNYQINKNANVQAGNITSKLFWQGSPAAISYPRINGDIALDATNAYVHNTKSQTVALLRFTGLLSILNIIDLLALESSDRRGALLLQKTTANVRLVNGELSHAKPLTIDAIGFTASAEGKASLVTGEVDMSADIELKLEQTLSLAALASSYPAIVAAPVIGIPLAWITHKIVIEPLTHFSYRITGNTRSEQGVQVENLSIKRPQ